jgi:hypothetical protein
MTTHLPAKPSKRSPPGKIGGRLKQCIDAMVWENLTDSQAAVKFKFNVNSIRSGLKRAPVLRYLKEQRMVLHARELARNSHTLIEVRDKSLNGMARIAAARELGRVADDEQQRSTMQRAPGVTIVLINPDGTSAPYKPAIEVTTHEPAALPGIDDDAN